jgi:hypothetical protein
MRAAASCLLLLIAGCAREQAAYPSLAPRAAEARGFAEPVVTPPPAPVADPELEARLTAWTRSLAELARNFDQSAAGARTAAAAAGARTIGSEAWLTAQSALAVLDDVRSQTSGLAAEVDEAAREQVATQGAPPPALATLRMRVEAEAVRQSDAIAAVAASLPVP